MKPAMPASPFFRKCWKLCGPVQHELAEGPMKSRWFRSALLAELIAAIGLAIGYRDRFQERPVVIVCRTDR
jgi:hypothetical protein